ncbi:long-chain-fatty-acid--CoA ligase 5-like [Asterias amurensis]|uniref:long-chain-fatty-acid--CoA ligase 5-like n=1 Tax=Asterias amurensis TaxID=7602 RepID=UPI003AB4EE85
MASSGVTEQLKKLGLPDIDPKQQSVELPGTTEYVRVSPLVKDGKLISRFYDGVESLHDCFMRGLKLSANAPCLGWRAMDNHPYCWITYEQVYARAMNFGSGLIQKGLSAGNDTYIGIYCMNRVEWVLTEQGCSMYSMVVVPLYDTLGPEVCQHIVNQVEISLVVCDTSKRAEILLDQAASMPGLKQIVIMEEATEEMKMKATSHNIELLQFADVEELGANNRQEKVPPVWETVSTICYTSGTTGTPKGVILTHGNILACVNAFFIHRGSSSKLDLRTDDVYISYLPLAHIYERLSQVTVFINGGRIGFFRGDPKKLLDDIKELRPTMFPCVPRVMNKIYDKVQQGVAAKGMLAKFLLNTALSKKTKELERGIFRNDSFWDRIFGKIRVMTGGRVRFITTGAAPVSHEVKMFFRCALGASLIEGYGQTESGSVSTITLLNDVSANHVGCPLVSMYYKLQDVPEMDYYAKDCQGEICLKGFGVFKGYFKEPAKTAETIDEDGWLHTGDIGKWLPNGQLSIIDRKKHIFKMAQGEYIAPEKIENVYIRSEFVSQCFVHGDGLKASLIAIVVPDEEVIPKLAKSKGVAGGIKEICLNKDVKKAVLDDMVKIGKVAKLHSFEQVKDIYLESELFSVENNLLTPTMKSKRPCLKKHYAEQIESLYNNLE